MEGNYDITKAVGKLTVTASENVIIVTAASADKTYDGTPLTDAATPTPESLQVMTRLLLQWKEALRMPEHRKIRLPKSGLCAEQRR